MLETKMDNTQKLRHVLVAGHDTLVDEILQRLLRTEIDWKVTSILFKDEETFIEDVMRIHPDVIVFNRASRVNFAGLFGLLAAVLDPGCLQMVVVGADSNTIDVYEKQQVFKLNSHDFIDLLKGSTRVNIVWSVFAGEL